MGSQSLPPESNNLAAGITSAIYPGRTLLKLVGLCTYLTKNHQRHEPAK
jgi:hypothetical protein